MWARDILPGSLDRPGKKGRYLTFGYPAPIKDSDEISQNIEDTARDLLQKILDDRGKVPPLSALLAPGSLRLLAMR